MHMSSIFDLRRGTCARISLKSRIIFFCGGIWLDYLYQLRNTFKTIPRMMDFPRGLKSTINFTLLQVLGTSIQTQFFILSPPPSSPLFLILGGLYSSGFKLHPIFSHLPSLHWNTAEENTGQDRIE